jgi:hypothetical protein
MWELIAERPNTVPVGLGNSETDIDMSIITTRTGSEPNSGYGSDGLNDDGDESGAVDVDEGVDQSDGDEDELTGTLKRKASTSGGSKVEMEDAGNGRTGAKPGILRPVSRAPKNTMKKQKKDEFAEIAQAEEVTQQKELDLLKAKAVKETVKAKAKLAKLELEKQKLADARERRQQKMELKMRFMGGGDQRFSSQAFPMDTHPNRSASSYTSMGPFRDASVDQASTSQTPQFSQTSYYRGIISPSYSGSSAGHPMSNAFSSPTSRGVSEPGSEHDNPFAVGMLSDESYRLPSVPGPEK